MQLLREKVNTEVTVLASLRRGGDADDLAGASLKNQEIANADVMAWDSNGVGNHGACIVADGLSVFTTTRRNTDLTFSND